MDRAERLMWSGLQWDCEMGIIVDAALFAKDSLKVLNICCQKIHGAFA